MRRVDVLNVKEVFNESIFRIDKATLRHSTTEGKLSEELIRFNVVRADSAAVLLHDLKQETILLVEQFRYATLEHDGGWIYELPAGTIDPGESPESCARREVSEETGFKLKELERIATVYLSPGGCSERIHIYYTQMELTRSVGTAMGNKTEGEDIKFITLTIDEANELVQSGRVRDAKTLIALQWLGLTETLT